MDEFCTYSADPEEFYKSTHSKFVKHELYLKIIHTIGIENKQNEMHSIFLALDRKIDYFDENKKKNNLRHARL